MSASKGTHTKSQPQSPEHPKHVYEFVRKQNENRNNEYQLLNLLGEGGFAKCYKTKRTHDKREFAIKAINLNDRSDSSSQDKKKSSRHPRVSTQQKAMAEANFLKICNHHNIVRYETHFTYDNVFYIVMEHCSNGVIFCFYSKSFGDMLKHRKTITEVESRYYLLQMVHGLIYLK
jgi:polo-like kinase 1